MKKTKNNDLRGARVGTPCENGRRPSRAARDEFPFEASETDGRLLALSEMVVTLAKVVGLRTTIDDFGFTSRRTPVTLRYQSSAEICGQRAGVPFIFP